VSGARAAELLYAHLESVEQPLEPALEAVLVVHEVADPCETLRRGVAGDRLEVRYYALGNVVFAGGA
jgi:hypothetical protein